MPDVLIIFIIALVVVAIGGIIILYRAAKRGLRAERELWHQRLMLKERICAASVKDEDTTVLMPPGEKP
jgi:hypothetical protein